MSGDGAPATRTGSFPAVTVERPSPPPAPARGTSEWSLWVEKHLASLMREMAWARENVGHLQDQIGRPPIPAMKDMGAGMWLVLADVRADCTRILEKLDAQDAASATWGARLARIGWKLVETLIPVGVLAFLAWLAGFHR